MIAFHLIISAYGFWLPNDPRGSWSDFVGAWDLRKFGPATKVHDGRNYARDPHDAALRRAAKQALKYPAVRFGDAHRDAIADGFGSACGEADYVCLACCVGHDHAHLVIAAHSRPIALIASHLKSKATRAMNGVGLHPLAGFSDGRGELPSPWAGGCWKVFLDDVGHVVSAVRYVDRHAEKEGLPRQAWPFVRAVDPRTIAPRRAAEW